MITVLYNISLRGLGLQNYPARSQGSFQNAFTAINFCVVARCLCCALADDNHLRAVIQIELEEDALGNRDYPCELLQPESSFCSDHTIKIRIIGTLYLIQIDLRLNAVEISGHSIKGNGESAVGGNAFPGIITVQHQRGLKMFSVPSNGLEKLFHASDKVCFYTKQVLSVDLSQTIKP